MTDVLVSSRAPDPIGAGRYAGYVDDIKILDTALYHYWWLKLSPDGTRICGVRNLIADGLPGNVLLYFGLLERFVCDIDGTNLEIIETGRNGGHPEWAVDPADGIVEFREGDVANTMGIGCIDPDDGSLIRWIVDPAFSAVTDPADGPGGYVWCDARGDIRAALGTRFTIPIPEWLEAAQASVPMVRARTGKTSFDPIVDPAGDVPGWRVFYLEKDDTTGEWAIKRGGPGMAPEDIIPSQPDNILLGPPQLRTDGSGIIVQRIDLDAVAEADAGWQAWTVDRDGTNLELFLQIEDVHVAFPSLGVGAAPSWTKASIIANAGLTNPGILTAAGSNEQTASGTEGSPILIENKEYADGLRIRTGVQWVTWRNCLIYGDAGDQTVKREGTAGTGIRFENCDVGDDVNSAAFGSAASFTLYRCDIHSSSDGLKAYGTASYPCVVNECYIHDLRHIEGVDHSDAIQFYQSTGHTHITHSVIEGASAAIFCGDTQSGDLEDVLIDANWLGFNPDDLIHGSYVTRLARDPGTEDDFIDLVVTNNRFDRIGSPENNSGWASGTNGCLWSGNVHDDDSEPIPF